MALRETLRANSILGLSFFFKKNLVLHFRNSQCTKRFTIVQTKKTCGSRNFLSCTKRTITLFNQT